MAKLIPLEEVVVAISSSSDLAELVHLLYKIPTIDPIEEIDKMIEELEYKITDIGDSKHIQDVKERLECTLAYMKALKSRLLSLTQK